MIKKAQIQKDFLDVIQFYRFVAMIYNIQNG